jgi:hypothetical protein
MTFITLEGKEYEFEGNEQIYYADQVDRLVPYLRWERGGSVKDALEWLVEIYIRSDNSNVNIGKEAQRRLKRLNAKIQYLIQEIDEARAEGLYKIANLYAQQLERERTIG